MAEYQAETAETTVDERPARTGPDPFTLTAGIVTLVVSGYVISGGHWFDGMDPRWVLAGGALLVGMLLLIASLRPGRGRNR